MVQLDNLSLKTFLHDYWQKKPLIIRNAIPEFTNPLSPEELAGLALEEDVESRIVMQTPNDPLQWRLKRGPFKEKDFSSLPATNWTLLVQGVELLVPEVYALLRHFDFLPQWRFDDVMISYASLNGSVGPHYDNYDVFLYQAKGSREWRLTTQQCVPENYIDGLELRIMREFAVEQCHLLQEGDMLYLPPHIGHYGIARSEHCMTYSFGYRSYQGQEMWDSLGDYLSEHQAFKSLYRDPSWSIIQDSGQIPPAAWQKAQALLSQIIDDERQIKSWMGCFATQLDSRAEQYLPEPLDEEDSGSLTEFINKLHSQAYLQRHPTCRMAYQSAQGVQPIQFYVNGQEWEVSTVSQELLILIANQRVIATEDLNLYLSIHSNQLFLFALWKLHWLQ